MKILIAEDTMDLNHVLTVALQHSGYDVDSALDGEEASKYIRENGYDLIILDIMMPKKDGITVLKELREEHITTPVMMLTAKAEVDDRVLGLDSGADDYLAKPFAMKELLARVRAMARRNSLYQDGMDSFGDLKLDSATCEIRCENTVRLSVREFDLLQLLIRNSGKTLETSWLLQNVWSGEEASADTVKLYILYLKGKLSSVSSRIRIEGDPENGYRLEETEMIG